MIPASSLDHRRRVYARYGLSSRLLLVTWASSVWAEICPGNQENLSRVRRYDQEIFLSAAELEESDATHLRFGRPACARYLFQRESVVCYAWYRRVALWAIYRLRKGDLVSRERRNLAVCRCEDSCLITPGRR